MLYQTSGFARFHYDFEGFPEDSKLTRIVGDLGKGFVVHHRSARDIYVGTHTYGSGNSKIRTWM
jgi:hypothetical protein